MLQNRVAEISLTFKYKKRPILRWEEKIFFYFFRKIKKVLLSSLSLLSLISCSSNIIDVIKSPAEDGGLEGNAASDTVTYSMHIDSVSGSDVKVNRKFSVFGFNLNSSGKTCDIIGI